MLISYGVVVRDSYTDEVLVQVDTLDFSTYDTILDLLVALYPTAVIESTETYDTELDEPWDNERVQ